MRGQVRQSCVALEEEEEVSKASTLSIMRREEEEEAERFDAKGERGGR